MPLEVQYYPFCPHLFTSLGVNRPCWIFQNFLNICQSSCNYCIGAVCAPLSTRHLGAYWCWWLTPRHCLRATRFSRSLNFDKLSHIVSFGAGIIETGLLRLPRECSGCVRKHSGNEALVSQLLKVALNWCLARNLLSSIFGMAPIWLELSKSKYLRVGIYEHILISSCYMSG